MEGLVMDHMSLEKKDQFANMVFDIHFDVANILKFGEGKDEAFTITDMHFSVAE